MYMQRILFILTAAVLSLLAGEAYAQRDLPGQTGIQFTTGGVNHFLSWKSGGERHYFTSLAFTHTNRNRTYWLYGLDYQIKEYTYENKAIPKAQFAGTRLLYSRIVGQGPECMSTYRTLGIGRFRDGQPGTSLLPDGATVTNGDCFIYGGGLTAAFETYLTDRVMLLLQVKERALFGTDAGNFHTQVGLGVRLIIN